MFSGRLISAAVRGVAIWLLGLSVVVGPLGIGASVASATGDTCGSSCPCDEAGISDHGDGPGHGDGCGSTTPSEHHDEEPADHQCPDNCPDCSCCPGAVLGVVTQVVPDVPLPSHASRALTPLQSTASGVAQGVFRPPRSRA